MEFTFEKNRVYSIEKGVLLANVTFPFIKENVVEINHTFVDESLRGQGVASTLMMHAYETIKKEGFKAIPTCTYAVAWFKRNQDKQDVLVPNTDLDNPMLTVNEVCAFTPKK